MTEMLVKYGNYLQHDFVRNALIVDPDHAEGEHSFRLDHTVEKIDLFIFGVSGDHGIDRGEDLFDRLNELGLVLVFFSDVVNDRLQIGIHVQGSPLSIFP